MHVNVLYRVTLCSPWHFVVAGSARTEPAGGATGPGSWFPQEPRRAVAATGEEETGPRRLHDTRRVEAPTQADLRLLMDRTHRRRSPRCCADVTWRERTFLHYKTDTCPSVITAVSHSPPCGNTRDIDVTHSDLYIWVRASRRPPPSRPRAVR